MICDPRYDLSWRMFHEHFRRKCILLFLDGLSYKYQLSPSCLMYHRSQGFKWMEQDVLTQSLSSNDCHCLSNILHTLFKPHSGSSLGLDYIQSPAPGPYKLQCHSGRARAGPGVSLLLAWPPGPELGSCVPISQPGPDLDGATIPHRVPSPSQGGAFSQTQHQEWGGG